MNFNGKVLLVKFGFLASLLTFSGCDSTEGTVGGGAIGTALGAAVGYAAGGSGGAAIGGVIGGLGGGAIGHSVGKNNEQPKQQVIQQTTYRTDPFDEYELRAMRNEVERQRLLNEKLLLEKQRADIIGK